MTFRTISTVLCCLCLFGLGACSADEQASPGAADSSTDSADGVADVSSADDGDSVEPLDGGDLDVEDAIPDIDVDDSLDVADLDLPETEDLDGADPTDALDTEDAPDGTDLGDGTGGDTLNVSDAADAPDTDMDTGPVVGPFDDLEGLSGAALRAALLDRIDEHTSLGYDGGGTAREYMYAVLDAKNGRIECVYTGRTVDAENASAPPLGTDEMLPPIDTTPEDDCRLPDQSPVPGGCLFNTEHSWPQSLGADVEPARSDLHHLFPAYEYANGARSNHAFGDTTCNDFGCIWNEAGSELGTAIDGYTAFEVRPETRGNIARAQFYFAIRYDKTISDTVESDLRAWHAADPPDDAENVRNEGIFALQENRNPFVSRPDFVALIDDF